MLARVAVCSRVMLACIAAFTWGVEEAAAADRKVPVAAGTLILTIDPNWSDATDMPEGFDDAVGFKVGDGSLMRWLFVPGNDAPPGSGATGNLRILTMDLRRMLEAQGAQMPDDLLEIEGSKTRGFYVKATDPKPKAGEHKFMYTGWVAVDGFPVMFNIVWNAGGQGAADRAITAIKSMRIVAR